MLRNLSVILALSVVVTACGGSSSGKKNSSSSLSSSVISSSTASEAPASSSVSSASSDSSSNSSDCPLPKSIDVDVADSSVWEMSYNAKSTKTHSNTGVVVNYVDANESASAKFPGNTTLNNVEVTVSFIPSQEFIASGGFVEIFAQELTGSYAGDWRAVNHADLTANTEITRTVTLSHANLDVDNTNGKVIGLMSKGSNGETPSGTVTITGLSYKLAVTSCEGGSSSSSGSAIYTTDFSNGIQGFQVGGNTALDTTELGLSYNATSKSLVATPKNWDAANYLYQARLVLPSAIDMTGLKGHWTISVPQAYLTDGGLSFQMGYFTEGEAESDYGAIVKVSDMVANADGTYTISTQPSANVIDKVKMAGFQFNTPPTNKTILSPVTIHRFEIK